jgi:hypothetical protein
MKVIGIWQNFWPIAWPIFCAQRRQTADLVVSRTLFPSSGRSRTGVGLRLTAHAH